MDEKYLRYRAAKISKREDISIEDALAIAERELANDSDAERQARIEKHKAASKKLTQKLKRNNKRTTYVVGDNIVDSVVSGGLPTLGKHR